MPRAIAVAAAISFLRIEVSPLFGVQAAQRCAGRRPINYLKLYGRAPVRTNYKLVMKRPLFSEQKIAALHVSAIDENAETFTAEEAHVLRCTAACGKIARIFCVASEGFSKAQN